MKGLSLQLLRNGTNLKQLRARRPAEIKKARLSRRQVICFIICYRGVVSYVCFSSIIIFIEPQSKCFARRLAFGGATCPELLKCGWLEAAEECVSFLTGLDGG